MAKARRASERLRARRALFGAAPAGWLTLLVAGFVLVGGSTLTALQLELPKPWLAGVSAASALVYLALAVFVIYPAWIALEERRLARLPFRFGVSKYLKALGKGRRETRVKMVATFAHTPDAEAKAEILGRVAGGEGDAKLSGRELTVRATLETYVGARSSDSDTDRYRNHAVHALVRRALGQLSSLHGPHPVEGVAVTLSGD